MAAAEYSFLSQDNQFSFKCPIFDAEVKIRGCVMLRDRVYAGQKLETRRGCQACISSGKCPAAEMVRRATFGTADATDHCYSPEPKVGRLPGDVLDKIAPILMQNEHLRRFGVGPHEVAIIEESRERIDAQALTAPRTKIAPTRTLSATVTSKPRRRTERPAEAASAPVAAQTSAINMAAASGDLSAALNAA